MAAVRQSIRTSLCDRSATPSVASLRMRSMCDALCRYIAGRAKCGRKTAGARLAPAAGSHDHDARRGERADALETKAPGARLEDPQLPQRFASQFHAATAAFRSSASASAGSHGPPSP